MNYSNITKNYMAGKHVETEIVECPCQGSFGYEPTGLQDSPLQGKNLKQPWNVLNQND